MQYLLESTICLACFYGFYRAFLQRETFFQWNRIYLLLTPVLAMALPLLNIRWETPAPQSVEDIAPWTNVVAQVQTIPMVVYDGMAQPVVQGWSLTIATLLWWIYGAGICLMAARLLWRLRKLYLLLRHCRREKMPELGLDTAVLAVSDTRDLSPASFFGFIFWNPKTEHPEHKTWILMHELVHVRQWHSADVLLMETLVVVQWFNPLIHAFRRSLCAIHEYIADDYVVRRTRQRHQYASLLVQQQTGSGASPGLFNTFHSLIKHRLIMLTKSPSRPVRRAKYLLAMPLFALLLLLFSFRMVETLPVAKPLFAAITAADEWAENLKEVTILAEKMPETAPHPLYTTAADSPYIFYWGTEQCRLQPALSTGKYTGTIELDPLSFGRLILQYPRLWDGKGMVEHFSFTLKGCTATVEGRDLALYQKTISPLQPWAKQVKLEERCTLSNLTLPDGTTAEVTVVFKNLEGSLPPAPSSLEYGWGKRAWSEGNKRDMVSASEFWEIILKAPIFQGEQGNMKVKSTEITILPYREDPVSLEFSVPNNEAEGRANWARLQALRDMIRKGTTVFLESKIEQDHKPMWFGTQFHIEDESAFHLSPTSGSHDVAFEWGPVRFDLGRNFDRYANGRIVKTGTETTFTKELSLSEAFRMVESRPTLLVDNQPIAGGPIFKLSCDTLDFTMSGSWSPEKLRKKLQQHLSEGSQMLLRGGSFYTADLRGVNFRFLIKDPEQSPALKPNTMPVPQLDMTLQPNPAKTQINLAVNMSQPCKGKLTVVSALGQIMQEDAREWTAGINHYTLNIETWHNTPGIYLLTLETPQGRVTKSFVVE